MPAESSKNNRPKFQVPAKTVELEYEVKKSRFIARAVRAQNREQALAILEQARKDYPDARHHCWAYLIGNPRSPATVAMSDDGEPSGTAGKPILNVLQHKDVGDVMLVVIRYFGGIKLGAGGLVRAYSHAAQLAMTDLTTETLIPLSQCLIKGGFEIEQPLRHWLDQRGGGVSSVEYGQNICCQVELPDLEQEALQQFVQGLGAEFLTLE
ncbi:YigZ family protein [Aestuariicella sp. G3-2]|uniref:IMPACT family protein n=1 Tax=Pseudomaricurvus albidus TaxID=2842452 RepID=UPI001C0C42FB|nr:YigZ family protein [Aestuariicella albida]MBU3070391.1 YigZ family protein [Aestuariicella albida]